LSGKGPANGQPVAELHEKLHRFCSRTTPDWALAPHGAYLDISGCGRIFGRGPDGPAKVCHLAQADLGCLCGGAGSSLLAARLASRIAYSSQPPAVDTSTRAKEPGVVFVVPPGNSPIFLASFPVAVLEDFPTAVRQLQNLGVRTLGDLQVVPEALLRAVFGDQGKLLAAEAWGQDSFGLGRSRAPLSRFELVAGARLARPLESVVGQAALGEGLALRAMAIFPLGPRSCPLWQLRSGTVAGAVAQATLRSADGPTLGAWRRLVQALRGKLPANRPGIKFLELHALKSHTVGTFQGELFVEGQKEQALALALSRINRQPGSGVRPASEQLLDRWQVNWYGSPKSGIPDRS
jgi:hypothetical protein